MKTTVTDDPVWYQLTVEEAATRLGTRAGDGLNPAEVEARTLAHGRNEIEDSARRGPVLMFLGQFTDFMIVVLLAAAVVSGLIGDVTDTLVILVIVVLNAIIGFVQEYRAERAIAALKSLAAPTAHVLRDGVVTVLPAIQLVPGDVVLLESGQAIPADLRLIETAQLRIDEAAMTGESYPVEKHTRALPESDLPIGDRRNMAYKGTLVTNGRGRGWVVATGMRTELGRIAALLRSAEEVKTPLQKRLARFGRRLSIAVLAICAILFAAGVLRGEPVMLMLLTAISLAVAAIPEALPAVVTVSLALGARKMVGKHVLIRKLPAVETLGSVTFICSDKTGTLTLNKMRVEEVFADRQRVRDGIAPVAQEPWRHLFTACALSNDARVDAEANVIGKAVNGTSPRHGPADVQDARMPRRPWTAESGLVPIGDPTEVALFEAARAAGFEKDKLAADQPRLAEIPFEAERARMTTLHRAREGQPERVVSYTKGAPEVILDRCVDMLTAEGRQSLARTDINTVVNRMAADGLRVLAFAMRTFPAVPEVLSPDNIETGLTFLGLVGMLDPPRTEAAEAVNLCRRAGITPVMITGDHPATARAIATRLGIIENSAEVLTGQDLARLSMSEFEAHVKRVRVYARVAPEQKIKIVEALQDQGEFVSMTGDGVNDAPALKRADIGVAMGITGTDVAKEAAHMILLDDNFASIVGAVREGRRIFDNIRKFVCFNMTGNAGAVLILFLAPFLGLPIPLLPIHILWFNMVVDGLPGLTLSVEKADRDIMQRPPRLPTESIFAKGIWQHVVWVGLLMSGVSLVTQTWAIHSGSEHWQTMVFTVLTLSQLGHVLAIRSETKSLFTQGMFSNRPLLGAVLLTFGLQMATIYIPWLNPIFQTEPLTFNELAFCLAMSTIVFAAVEIEKFMIRRRWLYR